MPEPRRVLIFPVDTKVPLPRRYSVRVTDGCLVKLCKMQPWEQEAWLIGILAVKGDKNGQA